MIKAATANLNEHKDSRSVDIEIVPTGEKYRCGLDESLLTGMLRAGMCGIPVGCRNGGCGVCKVRIIAGEAKKVGSISAARVTDAEQKEGYTLACRTFPVENVDVKLEVCRRRFKPFFSNCDRQVPASAEKAI